MTSIVAHIPTQHIDTTCSKTVTLAYHDRDPLAVQIMFEALQGGEVITWQIARDLIADVLTGTIAGDPLLGDVVLTRMATTVTIDFRSSWPVDAVWFTVTFPLEAVAMFFTRTLAVVHLGDESYDIDAELYPFLDGK